MKEIRGGHLVQIAVEKFAIECRQRLRQCGRKEPRITESLGSPKLSELICVDR